MTKEKKPLKRGIGEYKMNWEIESRLRREADILERIENVKRLIQTETTLLTVRGGNQFCRYKRVSNDESHISPNSLIYELREEIQLQLLSITALCYGDNPDVGEPMPMLEWETGKMDKFRDAWEECLSWNA